MVTISGTGFSPATTGNVVMFNGAVATVVAASATMLGVTVPAGASTGKIAVSTAGNSTTSAQDFVVATSGSAPLASAAAGGYDLPAGSSTRVHTPFVDPALGATPGPTVTLSAP